MSNAQIADRTLTIADLGDVRSTKAPQTIPPIKDANKPLSAKSLKVTMVLVDAEALLHVRCRSNDARVAVRIAVCGRAVTADPNAESLRNAFATINETGSDNVACILQGRLENGDALADAELQIVIKAPTQ